MRRFILGVVLGWLAGVAVAGTDVRPEVLNAPLDIAPDFANARNDFYIPKGLADFDPATGVGHIAWRHAELRSSQAFNNTVAGLQETTPTVFPKGVYAAHPVLPFEIAFVGPNVMRLRVRTSEQHAPEGEELMLVQEPARDASWKYEAVQGGHRWSGAFGSVTLREKPWRIELRNTSGTLLTRTLAEGDTKSYTPSLPFSFIRRGSDLSRSVAANFELAPGEAIVGGGESFTALNKRGQRLVLWADDAQGTQGGGMYKPVPFLMSSRGYGMFVHSSAPMTFDVGATFGAANQLLVGDRDLDLFLFLGNPIDVLKSYTLLTGRAPAVPLWSLGLWMSRISYTSEWQVREVAEKLRAERIPADVIHLDTGWFARDWECDYEFAPDRFPNPAGMLKDLLGLGLHVSVWQLPYFIPHNKLFAEIVQKGLNVRDDKGGLPGEDAILDFSNPETVAWYQAKLRGVLKQGVSAIKVDFGEAAPLDGLYKSGRTGFYEHNLYPLRYAKAAAAVSREVTGENIIWARSAWAGSQRYPIHWGGDAESTDAGMAATLRGGLSLGVSGFTFWSHDMGGGFTARAPEDLYARWAAFGMFTSHARAHGQPPKEPWEYGKAFEDLFRRADELRYELMPYIYTIMRGSCRVGLPVVRALLVEFPEDPTVWQVDDEYLFGSCLLIAPLMHAGEKTRKVYIPRDPKGDAWTDWQTGKQYAPGWQTIEAGAVPIIVLARPGRVIATGAVAQSTAEVDWKKLKFKVYPGRDGTAQGWLFLPGETRGVWELVAGTPNGEVERRFHVQND